MYAHTGGTSHVKLCCGKSIHAIYTIMHVAHTYVHNSACTHTHAFVLRIAEKRQSGPL